MQPSHLRILAFSVCLFAGVCTSRAETTIASLPFTISTPGIYVLDKNLQANIGSGNAITINASNVVIDFQGHSITGLKDDATQSAICIYANEQNNIVLRNGMIRFFYWAISINGDPDPLGKSFGHRLENMRVTGCLYQGILVSNAPGAVIHNCQVNRIGGWASGGTGAGYQVVGIELSGNGATVNNCEVADVVGFGASSTISILLGDDAFATNNRVSNSQYGIAGGKFQNNLASRCTTPFAGTDAGGNF